MQWKEDNKDESKWKDVKNINWQNELDWIEMSGKGVVEDL